MCSLLSSDTYCVGTRDSTGTWNRFCQNWGECCAHVRIFQAISVVDLVPYRTDFEVDPFVL